MVVLRWLQHPVRCCHAALYGDACHKMAPCLRPAHARAPFIRMLVGSSFFARFAAGLEKLLREKSGCGIRTGKEENTGSLFESPVLNSDLGCVGVYFLMTFLP